MLAADRAALLADTAQRALELRKLEFDYLALRYTTVGGLSSILTGFGYVGIIKTGKMYACEDRCATACELERRENTCPGGDDFFCYTGHCWLVSFYYSVIVISCCTSLYNFCLCSFLAIYGYGYALRGTDGSFVGRAIAVFLKYRSESQRTFVASVDLLAFIKIGIQAFAAVILLTSVVMVGMYKGVYIFRLMRISGGLVGGDVKLLSDSTADAGEFDLETTQKQLLNQRVSRVPSGF